MGGNRGVSPPRNHLCALHSISDLGRCASRRRWSTYSRTSLSPACSPWNERGTLRCPSLRLRRSAEPDRIITVSLFALSALLIANYSGLKRARFCTSPIEILGRDAWLSDYLVRHPRVCCALMERIESHPTNIFVLIRNITITSHDCLACN